MKKVVLLLLWVITPMLWAQGDIHTDASATLPFWPTLMGAILVIFLVVYCLTGGADYGGGVWDLLASGPRKQAQRNTIKTAIGPIWEANHVWLIAMIVVLFSCFPLAFATISNALHLPLTALLFGIVLRGSAFVFRAYDSGTARDRWGLLFSISSIFTPVMLGICAGALSAGRTRIDSNGHLLSDWYVSWLQPFPLATGCYVLALFSFLAACYLAAFCDEKDLAEDFRNRALKSGVVVALCALASFILARSNAPQLFEGLTARPHAIWVHLLTAGTAMTAFYQLWQRNYRVARIAAAAQVCLIVLNWSFAQYPFLVMPDIPIDRGAAPEHILRLAFQVLIVGSMLLLPSFIYLYKVFAKPKQEA